jgi:hypothetical protein
VTFFRFEQGGNGDLWNIDTARYESALLSFIDGLTDTEG